MSIAQYFIWCTHQMVMFRECAVNLYQATRSDRYGLRIRLATHLLYDFVISYHIIADVVATTECLLSICHDCIEQDCLGPISFKI